LWIKNGSLVRAIGLWLGRVHWPELGLWLWLWLWLWLGLGSDVCQGEGVIG